MSSLKNDLLALKSKLETIETQIDDQANLVEVRKEKWNLLEKEVLNVIHQNRSRDLLTINVGGTKFTTRVDTLLSVKDTFFERLISSKRFDISKEIFIDRSPEYFYHILDFIRNKKINYRRFSKDQLTLLSNEAEYYNVGEICAYLEDRLKEVEFLNFEFSGEYTYNGQTAGTNLVEDLKDKSMNKGICTNANGWIIVELNNDWDFEEIEIAGWNGNSTLWYNANGAGASIETSSDRQKWNKVGSIPSNFGSTIVKVKLTKTSGRYIRFKHNSYMGIGYLNVIKLV